MQAQGPSLQGQGQGLDFARKRTRININGNKWWCGDDDDTDWK